MKGAKTDYVVDRVDAERYEPDIIDGTHVGEFHQVEPTGGSAEKLDACLWRSDPATYDYLFQGDEAFHVVEGAATIELSDTGEKIELRATSPTSGPAPDPSGRSRSRSRSSRS